MKVSQIRANTTNNNNDNKKDRKNNDHDDGSMRGERERERDTNKR